MLVRNWMTKDVITVTPETSILKISKLLQDHNIRRLPVVNEKGSLVGIVSDRDVRDASPSKATTLDMYEMRYLLAELKASSIMTSNPLTVRPTDTVEKTAMLMLDHKIGGLPVVDEEGHLCGIIADHDVFKALVNITGVREGGIEISFVVPNRQGGMRPVFDILRKRGARILSVLSSDNEAEKRNVFLRIREMASREEENELIEEIGTVCDVLYWVRSDTHFPTA